jgi:hypothetical protein
MMYFLYNKLHLVGTHTQVAIHVVAKIYTVEVNISYK